MPGRLESTLLTFALAVGITAVGAKFLESATPNANTRAQATPPPARNNSLCIDLTGDCDGVTTGLAKVKGGSSRILEIREAGKAVYADVQIFDDGTSAEIPGPSGTDLPFVSNETTTVNFPVGSPGKQGCGIAVTGARAPMAKALVPQ